jgi:hypothetical protein
MRGGTSEKRKDGMRWEEEVPHEIRKDFFIPFLAGRMGCGKRRGECMLLVILFEGGTLPQAVP